jgi:uncharacterized protein
MQVLEGSAGLPVAWSRMRGDLLDVNVWVALVQPLHKHHRQVHAYWTQTLKQFARENEQANAQAIPSKLYFCRTTMLGMVRVLSQSSRALGQPVSLAQAFSVYERLRLLDEVAFAHENLVNADVRLGNLFAMHPQLPLRMATDVYLAALAQTFNLRFVTLDRDFLRLDLPSCLLIPEDDAQ